MYYILRITHDGGNFIYPVPDVNKIKQAKYRKDIKECACYYPEQIMGKGILEITETQFEVYGKCRLIPNKTAIKGDSIDTVTFTVNLPYALENEQVNLFINDALMDFQVTDTNQAVFELTADSSMISEILEVTVESANWYKSDKCLLEVV